MHCFSTNHIPHKIQVTRCKNTTINPTIIANDGRSNSSLFRLILYYFLILKKKTINFWKVCQTILDEVEKLVEVWDRLLSAVFGKWGACTYFHICLGTISHRKKCFRKSNHMTPDSVSGDLEQSCFWIRGSAIKKFRKILTPTFLIWYYWGGRKTSLCKISQISIANAYNLYPDFSILTS